MMKINFISGMSCVGKSFYINQYKADNDIVIDLFKFQQEHGDYVTAEYLFYSQIERTLHRVKDCTVWIEVPFYKHYRRKAVISFFKTIAKGFGTDVEWNLTYVHASKERYAENIKLRFPDRSNNDGLTYYKNRLDEVEVPTLDEKVDGWDNINIISFK